jgi:DICT domain-containing protein
MSNFSPSSSSTAALLSVGELAERCGMPTATLRTWEQRYGFPEPERSPGGHRRYRADAVPVLLEVGRLRRTGLSMEAAIDAAKKSAARRLGAPARGSFYADLRASSPELVPRVLTKSFLSALTAAMEDEYCARAARPVVFACFQREAFYRRAEARWKEMARTAESAVVFADFERVRRSPDRPIEVPLAPEATARREWSLVCDAPGYSACLAGWELPASRGTADEDRRFETVWSLDARAVRQASRVGIGLVGAVDAPLAARLGLLLADTPPSGSPDLHAATGFFSRLLHYAGRAAGREPIAAR